MTNQSLLRVTHIMKMYGWSYRKAKKYFEVAKTLDNDPYGLRPYEIPKWTLDKVMNVKEKL